MKIDIIIPIFNQFVFTKQAIMDLSHLDNRHNIIIINNGSIDGSGEKCEKLIASTKHSCEFKIINLGENTGYSRANNLGYREGNGDIVCFLNNDIRVGNNGLNNWTDEMIKCCEDDNCLFSPTAGLLDDNFHFMYETQKESDKWNYLSGWCLFGRRGVFEKLCMDLAKHDMGNGPFFTDTFAYFEDDFMSFQAKHLGINLKLAKLDVKHIGRRTGMTMNLPIMYNSAREKFIKRFKEMGYGL